jgi:hypothetical protein
LDNLVGLFVSEGRHLILLSSLLLYDAHQSNKPGHLGMNGVTTFVILQELAKALVELLELGALKSSCEFPGSEEAGELGEDAHLALAVAFLSYFLKLRLAYRSQELEAGLDGGCDHAFDLASIAATAHDNSLQDRDELLVASQGIFVPGGQVQQGREEVRRAREPLEEQNVEGLTLVCV